MKAPAVRKRGRRVPPRRGQALGHPDLDRDEEHLYHMPPLDAELLGSVIIAENYWSRDPRDRGDPARLELLLAAHAGGDRPFNLAVLLMVAAVGEPDFRQRALQTVETLAPGIPRPPWEQAVSRAKVLGAWRTRDDWLELVTLSFAYPGAEPAAATAVVDRDPSPLITHTMIEPELEPALERLEEEPEREDRGDPRADGGRGAARCPRRRRFDVRQGFHSRLRRRPSLPRSTPRESPVTCPLRANSSYVSSGSSRS